MPNEPAARTPGAKRAGPGEYVFDLGKTMHKIMGGPAYSTAHGPCVEGDRMIVGLMRMKAGTGAEPHSHPNEQWIYVLEGTFRANIDGREIDAKPGSVVYIPANTIHARQGDAGGRRRVLHRQGRLAQSARHQGDLSIRSYRKQKNHSARHHEASGLDCMKRLIALLSPPPHLSGLAMAQDKYPSRPVR